MVIATNPLFPLKAILHRLKWAGLDPGDFIYISSYESNHYCKPQIEYYKEILNDTNKKPEDCIMVGNDVQEDMIASKLGIKTYLIDNYILNRNEEDKIVADSIGSYDDFYKFVNTIPNIK